MWCPVCKNEYIEGVTTCVDCGSELVTELPEEVDPDALQVIGNVTEEEIGNKFIQFFRFSGIKTCSLIPREEEGGFDIVVTGAEFDSAMQLIETFTNSAEDVKMDYNEIFPMIEERMEEIKKEEGRELLSDLRSEASTVYVNKKDKHADLKFSGYSFLAFGILGYVFVISNISGIITLFNDFSMCVLGVVFTAFLVFGILSLRKAYSLRRIVSEEENLLKKVHDYMNEHFTESYISSYVSETLSEEENFFQVTEILKNELSEQFPLFSKGYIDQLVDECYDDYCEKKAE